MYCAKCGQNKKELVKTYNYKDDSEEHKCWYCGYVLKIRWQTFNGELIPIRVIEAQQLYRERLAEDETIH